MSASPGVVGLILLVLVSLSTQLGMELEGNGYKNILVAINPSVPQDPQLLEKLKDMLEKATLYLHQATRGKLYFEQFTILVPTTWKNGSYAKARAEVYSKANVLIDKPNRLYGNEPYVLQYGECGVPGRYIHLTPEFMLNDQYINFYGPRDRLFVHEWAHLRWGVYDEYDEDRPFYLHGDVEATRCSSEIGGHIRRLSNPRQGCDLDPETGLPTEDCAFFINIKQRTSASIMYFQYLDSITSFCTKETHNIWAPNRQNRMCGESTEEVISSRSVDRSVYSDLKPVQKPPAVKIDVVQRQDRVVCLILDVSGSMGGTRIVNQKQAATLFIEKVIEEEAHVALVTFSSTASVAKGLTLISGEASRKSLVDALPTVADGGTEICLGLEKGLQVLGGDKNVVGKEIIFLTDGESNSPMNCLGRVVSSGVIVHTIAFGNKADKQLEQMAEKSGGNFLLAAEGNVDGNALVDVFASLSTADGDISQQLIQLESSGSKVNSVFSGSVSIDKTVGNNTSFLVIYEDSVVDVLLQSAQGGKTYKTADFTHDSTTKSLKLVIPGIATVGTWTYTLTNKQQTPQTMSMTVTSQAAKADVAPVVVNAHMSQVASDGSKPLLVYAVVDQGGLPVTFADVKATLVSDKGTSQTIKLLDNGAGADAFRNDGIYSKYFIPKESGRYSLKVKVKNEGGGAKFSGTKSSGALYVPGYIDEDGNIVQNPPKPAVPDDHLTEDLGNFSRSTIGGSFSVEIDPNVPAPNFPPNKITDLKAVLNASTVTLSWTAPGEDLDVGTAKAYEIHLSSDPHQLRFNVSYAAAVNTSSLEPQEAGAPELFSFRTNVTNGTTVYFTVRAEDSKSVFSDWSNLAQVTMYIPSSSPPGPRAGLILSALFLVSWMWTAWG